MARRTITIIGRDQDTMAETGVARRACMIKRRKTASR